MSDKALDNLKEIRELIFSAKDIIEEDEDLKMFAPLLYAELENTEKSIKCLEGNEPIIMGWYNTFPEILSSMGIHWYASTYVIG